MIVAIVKPFKTTNIFMTISINKRATVLILALTMLTCYSKSQDNFVWGKQFGSEKDEYVMNHLIDDNGNIYVAGKTTGTMDVRNSGLNDAFLTKIDSAGNILWTRQFGSEGDEDVQWSAIDKTGCVYLTGSTTGNLADKQFGMEDIFVVKYDPEGEIIWKRQFGTDSTDVARGIMADNNGYIYLTGVTGGKLGKNTFGKTDGFIMKLGSNGDLVFIIQFGTSGDDCCYAITGYPGSDIYVCGTTWGDLGGKNKGFFDGFTGQFTSEGKLIKYNQVGTEGFDIAMIIRVDNEKNLYVGGSTSGNFGCQQIGEGDGFLLKLSEEGNVLWKSQFGTKNHDGVRGIDFVFETSDNILVSGILNLPPAEAFIRMYKKDGNLLWERKFTAVGKILGTSGKDVSIDKKGNIYHVGLTGANMFGPLNGENDAYLVKLGLN
jgi:hypothetical protein